MRKIFEGILLFIFLSFIIPLIPLIIDFFFNLLKFEEAGKALEVIMLNYGLLAYATIISALSLYHYIIRRKKISRSWLSLIDQVNNIQISNHSSYKENHAFRNKVDNRKRQIEVIKESLDEQVLVLLTCGFVFFVSNSFWFFCKYTSITIKYNIILHITIIIFCITAIISVWIELNLELNRYYLIKKDKKLQEDFIN